MKTITVELNDGTVIVGRVMEEDDDNSTFECVDEEGLTLGVYITVED